MSNASNLPLELAELETERRALSAKWDGPVAQRNAPAEETLQRDDQRAELPLPQNAVVEPVADESPLPASETPELQFEEPVKQAPVDLNEVFRRVGAKIELAEEEPAPRAAETPPTQKVSSHNAAGDAPNAVSDAPAAEEGEESIDDYMNRLMQRVRVSSGESQSPARTTQRAEPIRTVRESSANVIAAEPPQPQPDSSPAVAVECG